MELAERKNKDNLRWRNIPGYEELYLVNEYGDVKRMSFSVTQIGVNDKLYTRFFQEKVLNQTDNGNGYLYVKLRKNGENKTIAVHRLVAKTFISNLDSKNTVNHKDGNKYNNHVDNLEWCTQSENNQHAHDNGLVNQPIGSRIGNSKLTEDNVLEIRKLNDLGLNNTVIANLFGVKQPCISKIINNKTWNHV